MHYWGNFAALAHTTFLGVFFCASTCSTSSRANTFLCEYIFARHFLRPDLLEVVAGPGEHIFLRHFLQPDLLEVVAGLGEHIFSRHFLRELTYGTW